MSALLELSDVRFAWPKQATLLNIAHLTLAHGETLLLKGPSGTGKTSLLSLLTGVNVPQHGQIKLLGQPLSQLTHSARDRLRADHIGYIFQQFNLLPFLSVADNVRLGCGFSKVRSQRAIKAFGSVDKACTVLLERLGLAELATQHAATLSIGQQQRVAAARALIGAPELIIADEPTSALDADRREDFLALLFEQCQAFGTGVLMVSHDASVAAHFARTLNLAELNHATRCR